MIERDGSLNWIEIPDFMGMFDFLDLAGLASCPGFGQLESGPNGTGDCV